MINVSTGSVVILLTLSLYVISAADLGDDKSTGNSLKTPGSSKNDDAPGKDKPNQSDDSLENDAASKEDENRSSHKDSGDTTDPGTKETSNDSSSNHGWFGGLFGGDGKKSTTEDGEPKSPQKSRGWFGWGRGSKQASDQPTDDPTKAKTGGGMFGFLRGSDTATETEKKKTGGGMFGFLGGSDASTETEKKKTGGGMFGFLGGSDAAADKKPAEQKKSGGWFGFLGGSKDKDEDYKKFEENIPDKDTGTDETSGKQSGLMGSLPGSGAMKSLGKSSSFKTAQDLAGNKYLQGAGSMAMSTAVATNPLLSMGMKAAKSDFTGRVLSGKAFTDPKGTLAAGKNEALNSLTDGQDPREMAKNPLGTLGSFAKKAVASQPGAAMGMQAANSDLGQKALGKVPNPLSGLKRTQSEKK